MRREASFSFRDARNARRVTLATPAPRLGQEDGNAPAFRRASKRLSQPNIERVTDDLFDPAIRERRFRTASILIRGEKPLLLLLDLMLPGYDGLEMMARVPELSDLPVIFGSGYDRDETIARTFDSGAADYMVKSFSPRIRCAPNAPSCDGG